ncbi:uncharacterized protein LOC135470559 [Liolophura sinensis]|uniref:uncharacterized protein LOC135470559 n=1 Tax=Liolophura sinensis TaxID=3198878 RepID=UPI0031582BA8
MDMAAAKGSVINKTRVSGKNDNFKGPLAATWPTWKSSKPGKVPSTGKWLNDYDVSLDRGHSLEVLHLKKSNTAAMSSTAQNRQEDIPLDLHDHDDDEDEDETEMTTEEKRAMFNAVGVGDIDLLEDLLDQPNADINVEWFGENLLMAAIRSGQCEMADFLIDNGVNFNHQKKVIELEEDTDHKASVYHVSCRQMAYDKGLSNIVELIDVKNGELFPFVKPRERQMRLRRPVKVTASENDCQGGSPEPKDGGSAVTSRREAEKNTKVNLRRESSDNDSLRDNDTDSGHHSDISRREDIADSPDTSFEQTKDEFRQGKAIPHDEGYCSISPLSSRRGTPTDSMTNVNKALMIKSTKSALGIKRETTKISESKLRDGPSVRKEVNAAGSYSRERRLWTPKSKKGTPDLLELSSDENPPALVRTQSPWQDDRPANSRRHRRLPIPPTCNAQPHKPRIMSPPSQSGNKVSKILTQTKIVTLPNKLSFPSLRTPIQATRIDVPGETLLESSSRSPVRTQLRYGQGVSAGVSAVDSHQSRKYDEHFVINTELVKRKKSGYRS